MNSGSSKLQAGKDTCSCWRNLFLL